MDSLIGVVRGVMLVAISASAALAQQDTSVRIDARWRPFMGCWASFIATSRGPDVCVIPTRDSNTVELIALVGDSIISRAPVSAAAARQTSAANECAGFESARWSIDDRRAYTFASYKCRVTGRRQWSSLYSMTSPTTFSRIESLTNDAGTSLRTINFVALDTTPQLPTDIQRRLTDTNARSMRVARAVASTELSTADVADAAASFHPRLVAEWLYDRGESFTLSRQDRRGLREVGLPREVIDAMQSLSSPERAALERGRNLMAGSSIALGKGPPVRRAERSEPGATRPEACAGFSHLRGVGCPRYSPGGWKVDEHFAPPFPFRSGTNPADIAIPLPKP